MNFSLYFLIVCSTSVLSKTPAELDSFEIFDFIKEEDLPRPRVKVDWIEVFNTQVFENNTAQVEINTLQARLSEVEKNIDSELRVLRSTVNAIRTAIARREQLSPGQVRVLDLVRVRGEILKNLEAQKWKMRNAHITIQWNKPLIESACRQRIALGNKSANEIVEKRNRAVRPLERAKILNHVISEAIARYSVEQPASCFSGLDAEVRKQFHSVAGWHIENEVADEAQELPRILRRKLSQKGWSFLHNFLEVIDVIIADYKERLVSFADKLKKEYAIARKSVKDAESSLQFLDKNFSQEPSSK